MSETAPRPPRRLFLASIVAAVAAAGATTLAVMGGLSSPQSATFQFARGTNLAAGEEERLRGYLVQALEDNRMTLRILGHSGTQGEASANLRLSEERADLVANFAQDMGISRLNLTATGLGGTSPFARPSDMSPRAHEAALARVDVILQVGR